MDEKVVLLMKEFEEEKEYWLVKLSGEVTGVKLFPDFPLTSDHEKRDYPIVFNSDLVEQIFYTGKNNDLSLYIILLAAFKVLLSRYSSYAERSEIIVSSPMHVKDEINYNEFIILRDFVDGEMTFLDVLGAVKDTVIEAYKNQHYPIKKVLEELGLIRYKDSYTYFALLWENIHKKDSARQVIDSAANAVTLSFVKANDGLEGKIIYNMKLFRESTIQRLFYHYERVLKWVLADMKTRLSELELISEEEKQRILNDFNDTGFRYPGGNTIHELFEHQVEKTPDNTVTAGPGFINAPTGEIQYLTYKELNKKSNHLARVLRSKGIVRNGIVGLILMDSLEMVVGILAVLKAGAAYLPIDPEYPREQKKHILKDSRADMLLIHKHLLDDNKDVLGSLSLETCIIVDNEIIHPGEAANAAADYRGDDLAYLIYTSGTTGKPKGVLVEHRGLVNYTNWRLKSYNYSENDVTLQLLSYCFDGFASNFYSGLVCGGTLVMVPGFRKLDFDYIRDRVIRSKVTNTSLVPFIMRMFLERVEQGDLESIRFVVLAGEKSDEELIEMIREKGPHILVLNEYGPTEATVTAAGCPDLGKMGCTIIGRPISNSHIYILDTNFKPVPFNLAGELFIGGAGVSRGYLNNPGLTAEKFCSVSYLSEKVYRTGDLGRWLADGNIEFLGRIDTQVKIRGLRIELGEIEAQLLNHGAIKEAVVVKREFEAGGSYLCAYIVLKEGGAGDDSLDIPALRAFLSGTLMEYMIPSHFFRVEKIPLSSNGKVNRKALERYGKALSMGTRYVKPGTEMEKRIADAWKDVLKTDKVGIHDNFFDLGGNSLSIIKISTRLKKDIGRDIPVVEMFRYPTVHSLSAYLSREGQEEAFSDERISEAVDSMEETMQMLIGDDDE